MLYNGKAVPTAGAANPTDKKEPHTRMENYITDLKRFVHKEQDTQNQQLEAMWQKSLAARVAEGEAIAGVEVLSVSADWSQALVRFPENLSKFRESDTLRLSRNDPTGDFIGCELAEEQEYGAVLVPAFGVNFLGLERGNGYTLDRDKVDVRHIQLNVLSQIEQDEALSARFRALLEGEIQPEIDPIQERYAAGRAREWHFNDSQQDAFIKAFAARNVYLIQGPPGTGKTWVLARLATELARQGQRVLLTAFTHRAVNNALLKIAQTTGYEKLCKIGQHNRAGDLRRQDMILVPNYERFRTSPYSPNESGLVVGGTCFAVRTSRLNEVHFDTVIFDEAGQMPLPLAFAGMLAADKAILIGDHQQMSPVITAEHQPDWVAKSIFETLFDSIPGTMLDTTYRMNAEINAFPSRQFYGRQLRSAPAAQGRQLRLERAPERYAEVLDPDIPNVFVEIAHANRGMRSPEEAEIAAGLAAEAVRCGVPAGEIAIVSPYRAQGRLIRQYLRQLARENSNESLSEIVVDTVERIQGQERDMVILSLATSDPQHAADRAEFYFQPNRLNVSITRPRVKRIVLGSPLLFQAKPADPLHQDWVRNFQALYESSTVVKAPGSGGQK